MAIAPFIIKAAVGVGFSKMLSSLLTPDTRSPLNTSKPAPLSERGSPIPLLVGRDLVAPVFAWEGRRRTQNEPINGGRGGKGVGSAGGGQQNVVNYADGMHVLTVGPGKRLRAIRWNGEQVWPHGSSGTGGLDSHPVDQDLGIEPHTSPSGSTFALDDNQGEFTIYWGEPDQPIETRLSSSEATGVSSNWSYIAYIYWSNTRLGGPGVWPTIEYDWEVGPFNELQTYGGAQSDQDYTNLTPAMTGSSAWLENGLAVDETKCVEIISYDTATSTLTCGGTGVFDLTGFTGLIRDNSPAADGRWPVQSVSTGGSASVPDGNRAAAFGAFGPTTTAGVNNSGSQLVLGSVTDLGGTGVGDPPGTSTRTFTEFVPLQGQQPQSKSVRYRLDRTTSGAEAGFVRLKFPKQLNSANWMDEPYLVSSVYAKAPATSGASTAVNLRLQVEECDFISNSPNFSVEAYVTFRLDDGQCSILDTFGGADGKITALGDRWFKLECRTPGLSTAANIDDHLPGIYFFKDADAEAASVELAYGTQDGFAYVVKTEGESTYAATTSFVLNPGPGDVTPFEGELCAMGVGEKGPQGANVAHILFQLLFQDAPHGLGLDQDCYDIASLQAIGSEIWNNGQGEGLRSHIRSNPDDTIEGLFEQLLAEAGIQRYWDVIQGKWGFKLVREEPAEASFPEDLIAPDPPEVGRSFGSETLTDLRFVFRDSTINYRENDVYIPLDGESATAVQRQALQTVRDEASAQIVSDRFAQIEQGRPATVTVLGLRDSQLVRVGDVLDFGDLLGPGVLYRATQVKLDPMRAVTELTLASEQYSVEPANATSTPVSADGKLTGLSNIGRTVAPDQDFDVWEASAFLGRKMQFVPLRIPSEDDATLAAFLASSDGVSYLAETSTATTPCGVLASDFSATESSQTEPGVNSFEGSFYIEDGPLFRAQANSIVGRVRTLSDADWGAGRQWLLINNEVMYVQEFEPLGDHLWRAKHVLRARLDSQRNTHSEGDSCYILDGDSLGLFEIPYAGRGQTVQVKSIPAVGNISAPPATVTAKPRTPTAKGISPIRLSHLREENFIDKWRVRDTVYRWDYSLPEALETRTGLGMQGAGELTSTSQDVWPGKFTVALADSGSSIIYGPVITTDNEIFVPSSAYSSAAAGDITLLVLAVDEFGTDGVRIQKAFPQA